jgi:hypothetical protein
MTRVEVIVASAEEADDGNAEFWLGPDLVGITVIHDERLHLRIDPRPDGQPWLIDTTSLAKGLADAMRELAAF